MKYFLITLAATVLCTASCTGTDRTPRVDAVGCTSSVPSQPTAEEDTSDSFYGTYAGTLPATEGGERKFALSIREDGTYSLKWILTDAGNREIEECGTYRLIGDTLIETTTPSSGQKAYYAYAHGHLILSDSIAPISQGNTAAPYVLRKTDSSDSPAAAAIH